MLGTGSSFVKLGCPGNALSWGLGMDPFPEVDRMMFGKVFEMKHLCVFICLYLEMQHCLLTSG